MENDLIRVVRRSNNILVEQIITLLNCGQFVTIRVKGNSMFPFFLDNRDLVTLRMPEQKDLKVGRVVLFQYGDTYLLHRIIDIKGNLYYIKGDNNHTVMAEVVMPDAIVGVVTAVNKFGCWLSCDSLTWKIPSFVWMKLRCIRLGIYGLKNKIKNKWLMKQRVIS